jgi:hypothetical protein
VTPGALLGAALTQGAAPAALPGTLLTTTLHIAAAGAAGSTIPARVAALTTGVMQTMSVSKLKLIAAVVALALGLVVLGSSSLAGNPGQAVDPSAVQKVAPEKPDPAPQESKPQTDPKKIARDIDAIIVKHYLNEAYRQAARQPRGQLVETDFVVKSVDAEFPFVSLAIADTQLTILSVRVAPDAMLQLWDGKKMKKMQRADLKPGMRVSIWVETKKDKSIIVGLTAFPDDGKDATRLQSQRLLLRMWLYEKTKHPADREQVRRLWLDLFGELPPPEELREERLESFRQLMERARKAGQSEPEKK